MTDESAGIMAELLVNGMRTQRKIAEMDRRINTLEEQSSGRKDVGVALSKSDYADLSAFFLKNEHNIALNRFGMAAVKNVFESIMGRDPRP